MDVKFNCLESPIEEGTDLSFEKILTQNKAENCLKRQKKVLVGRNGWETEKLLRYLVNLGGGIEDRKAAIIAYAGWKRAVKRFAKTYENKYSSRSFTWSVTKTLINI